MKKLLLSFVLISGVSFAQDCTKLFISEYVEGKSNNKALEIYNPTNATINLSEYFVARYSNGASSATVENAVQLTGSIPAKGVYVAVLEKLNPAGTGQEAPIWTDLQAVADGYYSPVYATSNCFYWNGNDAVLLAKGTLPASATADVTTANGFMIIDIFGKIGEDPGTAWSTTPPHTGAGTWITLDHHMQRKSTIGKGVNTPVSVFNPLLEWDTTGTQRVVNGDTIGDFSTLGVHDCFCNTLSTEQKVVEAISVYPNPSTDGVVYVNNAQEVTEIVIINALGQTVAKINVKDNNVIPVRIGDDRGVYFLKIKSSNGTVLTKRVVIK